MDDFKVVLGMDFLRQVKVVPLPFLRSMTILEEEAPCKVPTITEGKPKTPMLTTMQLEKELRKNEVIYLATPKEDTADPTRDPMPMEIKTVLGEFKDVMPPYLPKRFPPRREEDHKIKLPYRMAPQSWTS